MEKKGMDKREAIKVAQRYLDNVNKNFSVESAILEDFNTSNPVVSEILSTGINLRN